MAIFQSVTVAIYDITKRSYLEHLLKLMIEQIKDWCSKSSFEDHSAIQVALRRQLILTRLHLLLKRCSDLTLSRSSSPPSAVRCWPTASRTGARRASQSARRTSRPRGRSPRPPCSPSRPRLYAGQCCRWSSSVGSKQQIFCTPRFG